jgi:hypothetical protein
MKTNEQLRRIIDAHGFEHAAKTIDWEEIEDPSIGHYWGFMQDALMIIEKELFGEIAPPGGSGGS